MNLRFAFFSLLAVFAVAGMSEAVASQTVKMALSEVEVHQLPDRNSPQIARLSKGMEIPASSGQVKDKEGEGWYKVRLPTGVYGYVDSAVVDASDLERDLYSGGISKVQDKTDESYSPWNIVLRGMGIFGMELQHSALSFGGEAEMTFCLPFDDHGYLHRMISLGGVAILVSQDTIFAGSAVIRIFQDSRFEPEIRLRVGSGNTTGGWAGGAVGIDYPLSLDYSSRFAAYAEVGSMVPFSGQLLLAWGAAGIGFHF